MTITLDPQQERAIERLAPYDTRTMMERTVFEQGLGLFGTTGNATLLDEVVTLAYEERRHPVKQNPLFL